MPQTQRAWQQMEAPFVQGGTQTASEPLADLPLGRYFPPYLPGRASTWLNRYSAAGTWVLDPFGLDPYSALDLAQAGYRVAIASNNPIAAFVLETLSTTQPADWDEALLLLSNLKTTGGIRLEDYLESFYLIPCPNPECGIGGTHSQARVERIIHDDEPGEPLLIKYKCPQCKQEGELAIEEGEPNPLPAYPSLALYRARAMELVVPPQDPLRSLIEDVLKYYDPRPLVLLQVMLNRIQSSAHTDRQRSLMRAIFLLAADRVNVLWAYPLGRNRPRQLMRPPAHEELNLWQAVQDAVKSWKSACRPVNLRSWPDLVPQTGGISLFRGRLREWQPPLDPRQISAVHSVLPRRNQAFWNLSALWAGWLWGSEALEPMRNALLRQRYDWTWHTVALQKVLGNLPRMILPSTPILLQIPEVEPRFLLAGTLGAQEGGLQLQAYALSGDDSTLQTVWRVEDPAHLRAPARPLFSTARDLAREYLTELGEPSSYTMLFTQVLLGAQSLDLLHGQPKKQPNGTLPELEAELNEVLADTTFFTRFYPNITADSGLYWLKDPPAYYQPMADRVEIALREAFYGHESLSHAEVLAALHEQSPGLQTPDDALLDELLAAYAKADYEGGLRWHLRGSEAAASRSADLREMRALLESFANTLQYRRELSAEAVTWRDEEGNTLYTFFPITTAIVAPLLLKHAHLPGKKVVAIPGSKTSLLGFKLKRDPNLGSLVGPDWQFMRFRQLRALKENPLLSRELFLSQVSNMSPNDPTEQMALF